MKVKVFALRTAREILRDPINLGFGLGFPVIILLLLSAIQANIPVDLFRIEQLAPGIAIFGLSFITLFSATLIAKDRGSALLQRLYTTPLSPAGYIIGYTLPLLPISLGQTVICYGIAIILGLPVNIHLLTALLLMIPAAIFFIFLGLLCGSILNDKQVGGICGALLTNLTAWFSGTWFDLELVGGVFKDIAYALPFVHGVELERAAISGNYAVIPEQMLWVTGYMLLTFVVAVLLFLRQMRQ